MLLVSVHYTQLTKAVAARANNGAVGPDAKGVVHAGADGHDVTPGGYITLPLVGSVPSHSDNSAVGAKTHSAGIACADGRESNTWSYCCNFSSSIVNERPS